MTHKTRFHPRTATATSAVLALLVALLPPVGYFVLSYEYLVGSLDTQAQVRARSITQLIVSNPRNWRFEELRLSELLENRPLTPVPQVRRIVDMNGHHVVEHGDPVAKPWVTRSSPIYDAWFEVGRVEVVQSVLPLLEHSLLVGVVSLVTGLVFFLVFGIYPLRVTESALASLEESEHRYRSLYLSMKEGMALFRPSDPGESEFSLTLLDVNPAMKAMLGAEAADLAGMNGERFLGGAIREHQIKILLGALTREPLGFETSLPDRSRFFSVSVFYPEPGLVALLIDDLTEVRKAAEEREVLERKMLQAQKAESLGRMAGAIAHHFNNLLGVVMGNLELAMFDQPLGSELHKKLAEAVAASARAADISGLMLAYIGQNIGTRAPIQLSEIPREALPLLTASLPKKVSLRIDLPDMGPIVLADTVQIMRALTNLVENAGEAMGEREGDVTVSVNLTPVAHIQGLQFYPPEWEPKDENYACLAVSDMGGGMDPQTLEKVFDPFFTTKFTGRGLGLAVVLGVVKAHDGAITVESAPGQGTVFRIFLPLSSQALSPLRKAEPAETVSSDSRSLVLTVDDEPMLRRMSQVMLERLGYDVITAGDGVEAMDEFRKHQDRIQCVLLDLTMPRMGGWETLAALRAIRPDLPVILASGYDQAQVMHGYRSERPQAFLHKPYRMNDLKVALGAAQPSLPAHKGA